VTDSYSAGEASRVLGISERRVRQLAVSGGLRIASDKPLRLEQESVHKERDRRRTGLSEAPATAGLLTAEQAVALAERLALTLSTRAIESAESQVAEVKLVAEQVESALKLELAAARAEAAQLRAQLESRANLPNPVDAVRGLLRWRP
jgi:hypothetical protein